MVVAGSCQITMKDYNRVEYNVGRSPQGAAFTAIYLEGVIVGWLLISGLSELHC